MKTATLCDTQTGWTYSQAGTPVAYIMPLDRPGEAMMIPQDNWWRALRFAVAFAHENDCEFVGGPDL